MTTEQPITAESVMDRLCGIFSSIHSKWHEAIPTNAPIWEETQGLSNLGIIEKDIRTIGHFFADADDLGARAEYALLAECIAHIRIHDSSLPSSALLESEIDKAYSELEAYSAHTTNHPISTPLMWRLALILKGQLKTFPSDSAIDGLHNVLSDVASLFLLRDGNITPQEDEKLKEYNATFSR